MTFGCSRNGKTSLGPAERRENAGARGVRPLKVMRKKAAEVIRVGGGPGAKIRPPQLLSKYGVKEIKENACRPVRSCGRETW